MTQFNVEGFENDCKLSMVRGGGWSADYAMALLFFIAHQLRLMKMKLWRIANFCFFFDVHSLSNKTWHELMRWTFFSYTAYGHHVCIVEVLHLQGASLSLTINVPTYQLN